MIGAGFASGGVGVSGVIQQCTGSGASEICTVVSAPFTSNSAGTFMASFEVSTTFTGEDVNDNLVPVDCLQVECYVRAVSNSGLLFSQHHIDFAGAVTTTTTTLPATTTTALPTTTSTTTTIPATSTTQLVTTTLPPTTMAPTTTSSTLPSICTAPPGATIQAQPGTITYGTEGPDVIYGTAGPDRIAGLGGNDVIVGFGGDDQAVRRRRERHAVRR